MIKVVWSKGICVVQRLINHQDVSKDNDDMERRVVTFEGRPIYSDSSKIKNAIHN